MKLGQFETRGAPEFGAFFELLIRKWRQQEHFWLHVQMQIVSLQKKSKAWCIFKFSEWNLQLIP
jgi:hypothetical protein